MSTFNEFDWDYLSGLFVDVHEERDGAFRSVPYAGFRPDMVEAPNGDTKACPVCAGEGGDFNARGARRPCPECNGTGRVPNTDEGKRYLHVAPKYLAQHPGLEWPREYLARAHYEACRVAEALGVPKAFYPMAADGTLRVLDYPPGTGSAEHTDFDLFTILLWRSTPADLELCNPEWSIGGPRNHHPTIAGRLTAEVESLIRRREAAYALSPGLHIGEIGELVGLGPATPHRVPARPYRQRSIVYFAMPDHAARLPGPVRNVEFCGNIRTTGPTVGEWLAERISRSRVVK